MNTAERKIKTDFILGQLHDRAANCFTQNPVGAAYLACICGMHQHNFHVPYNNLFRNDNPELYQWFATGFDASKNATDINTELAARWKQYEKIQDAQRKETKKKP